LQAQSRYFVHHGETPDELDTLAKTVKHLMNWTMRTLGPIMTALPVGPQHAGQTAGPAFEIVRPAFFALPHREAAWKILRERFETLAEVSLKLAEEPGLSGMKQIATNFEVFASDLRQHLVARAAARTS
jgi:hypothetical protein